MPLNWLLLAGIIVTSNLLYLILNPITNWFIHKYHIFDYPTARKDKSHHGPIPLMGGAPMAVTAILTSATLLIFKNQNLYGLQDYLGSGISEQFNLVWVLFSILILLIGGILDDKFSLRGRWLFLYINLGVILAITLGDVRIDTLSEPFAYLPKIPFLSSLLSYIWLMFCIASTKFIDGHDGLSSTYSTIGLLTVGSVSVQTGDGQPLIFLLALIWAFSIIPFLFKNFPNATQYLGESGSEILGFVIGLLAILSGAKIATAYTLIGWFILDILFVFLLRFMHHTSILKPDRSHWHHRLIDLGLNKIQVLVLTTLVLLASAHMGLLLPPILKLLIIPIQIIFIVGSYLLTLVHKD